MAILLRGGQVRGPKVAEDRQGHDIMSELVELNHRFCFDSKTIDGGTSYNMYRTGQIGQVAGM
jgi:hypothetical protein